MKQPLLFLDCESLGTDLEAPVWEVAYIRVSPNGVTLTESMLVEHDPAIAAVWLPNLPQSFQDDYLSRYVPDAAMSMEYVVTAVSRASQDRALVCGSNPWIDMQWMERMAMLDEWPESPFKWHYHPEDVPTLARGWLNGKGVYPAPPWKSDFISQACGINPSDFDRHTAMGDCQWSLALWKQINGRTET